MSSSINQIKALVRRFVSLPPPVRMKLSKRLLELYGSEQAPGEVQGYGDSSSRTPAKSFLEQFWDEVEQAHGDQPGAVNPFTRERRSRAGQANGGAEAGEQRRLSPWGAEQSNLIALL